MIYTFKLNALYILLFVCPAMLSQGNNLLLNFDKATVYTALATKDVDKVNVLLDYLKESTVPEKMAYEGALLMKKAALVTKAKEKLQLFKAGRVKLEAAINNDKENVEYHFLRLIIQENAPKIVKYKSDLKNDTHLVRTSFKKLAPPIQKAVIDYSKHSAFLNPADF